MTLQEAITTQGTSSKTNCMQNAFAEMLKPNPAAAHHYEEGCAYCMESARQTSAAKADLQTRGSPMCQSSNRNITQQPILFMHMHMHKHNKLPRRLPPREDAHITK
jgi:hypothetical protein